MRLISIGMLAAWISLVALPASADWEYVRDGAGGFAVLFHENGDLFSSGQQGDPSSGAHELVVVRHDARTGDEKWRRVVSQGSYGARGVTLRHAPGDSLYVVSTQGGRYGGDSSDVLRLDAATGAVQWSVHLEETALVAASVDPAGDLVAAGAESGPDTVYDDQDFLALKFLSTTGGELWRAVVDGELHKDDRARSVATSPEGDVFVAGSIGDNANLNFPDFAVLKLSGHDGTLLWRRAVPSTSAHGGEAYSLAIDASGDAVAAGTTASPSGWCDFAVAKFSGSDGVELWRHVESFSCDFANSVVVDHSGDVLATGALSSFSTVNLSGSSGARLWRHDIAVAPGCSGHNGECTVGKFVVPLASGNALVSGVGPPPGGGVGEVIIAELNSQTGEKLWIDRRHHPDSCGDGGWNSGLAVSARGEIAWTGMYWAEVDGTCTWPPFTRYVAMKIAADSDGDGPDDDSDNCPFTFNPDQEDSGGINTNTPDQIGDACQCGDVTGNGIVNGQDATVITRHAVGMTPNPMFIAPGNCDVSGNGFCNGQDANAVKREALGFDPNPLFGQNCQTATLTN